VLVQGHGVYSWALGRMHTCFPLPMSWLVTKVQGPSGLTRVRDTADTTRDETEQRPVWHATTLAVRQRSSLVPHISHLSSDSLL